MTVAGGLRTARVSGNVREKAVKCRSVKESLLIEGVLGIAIGVPNKVLFLVYLSKLSHFFGICTGKMSVDSV